MIDYEAAEPAILALLAPLKTDGVQIRGLPDVPNQQGVPMAGVPVVVLSWFGSQPLDKGSADGTVQAMSHRIVAEIRCPTLRGTTGIYQLPGRVQALLAGQQIAGLGWLRFAGWQLLAQGSGPNDRGYQGLMTFTAISLAGVK